MFRFLNSPLVTLLALGAVFLPTNKMLAQDLPADETLVEESQKEDESSVEENEVRSERLLPSNTTAWVSIPDAEVLSEAIKSTQFGAMMEDPNVKPFVEDLTRQVRAWLNEQNIRFGMKVSDIESIQTGEVCLAGVLKQDAAVTDEVTDHALVLLVDVSETKEKAQEVLDRVGEEFAEREATEEELEIDGVIASKWTFKKPQGLRKRQYAFHAIVGKWLVASDNESTFRNIIERVESQAKEAPVLAGNAAFQKIIERCEFDAENYRSHIRWFAEPFGYIKLAQAISDAQMQGEGLRNDYAEHFHEEGFSAIKGVGGVVSVATEHHEMVHRTFIYAPPVLENEMRYERAAALLDFRNRQDAPLNPPAWVPADAAGYLTFTWDLSKALDSVSHIIDKVAGKEGSFQRALDSYRDDPKGPMVDVREMVGRLNNRITVCSVTQLPIDEESERILFGVKINGSEQGMSDEILRLMRSNGPVNVHEYNGIDIMVADTTAEDPGTDVLEIETNLDDEFGTDPLADEEEVEEEEIKKPKPLFEKRVVAVKAGYLIVGNHLGQVKSVLDHMSANPGDELTQSPDYERVRQALAELTGDDTPSFRHFGRLDQSLRTNYEMLRTGRMAQSKTVLAQLLNRAYEAENDFEDDVPPREQKLDGSKLPEDYEGKVAKYFGPTGLVIHSVDEGWVITGCVLGNELESTSMTKSSTEDLAIDKK